MDVSTSTNSSQSLALAAYTTQQQQSTSRPRDNERDSQAVDASRNTGTKRGDNVNFSTEALRLSATNGQDYGRNSVNRSKEAETLTRQQQQQLATRPEVARAESAKSVAKAINAYRSTSVI